MILVGDCRDVLRTLPEKSVQTVISSPPYFGLRDYGTGEWEGGNEPGCDHLGPPMRTNNKPSDSKATFHGGGSRSTEPWKDGVCGKCGASRTDRQIGLEPTPDEFVAALVEVFREVRRVLRDDGTVWLNLGDSYATTPTGNRGTASKLNGAGSAQYDSTLDRYTEAKTRRAAIPDGCKPKDLLGIPWMVAFALRADGWYLRSEIIWAKKNCMPESVTDRPTKAHEQIFLLSKRPSYFYDADAVRESDAGTDHAHRNALDGQPSLEPSGGIRSVNGGLRTVDGRNGTGRNKRTVWHVATQPFSQAHFATFPPKLIEPCILAGSPPKCCGVCGAPWTRIVERTREGDHETLDRPKRTAGMHNAKSTLSLSGNGSKEWAERGGASRTVGWESSCDHDDDTGRSIVLDPFAGAGTVGVVCGWHGREFIGIELNPEYAEMARERIALEGRPGGKPNGHEVAVPIVGQIGMFEGEAA